MLGLRTVVISDVFRDKVKIILDDEKVKEIKLRSINAYYFPFRQLNPLQTVFYDTYIEQKLRDNALVVAPTSSGKTGAAMLFMGGCGTYSVPTKSLANEIYNKFTEIFGKERVGLKTGDAFDEIDEGDKDIYVCTYESLANALRTKKNWVSLPIVIDEIHHIYKDRGVVVEEILGYLNLLKFLPFLTLSATIPDPESLGRLIGASYILISNHRPVPVKKIYGRLKGIINEEDLVDFIKDRVINVPSDENVLVFVHKKDIGYGVLKGANEEGLAIANKTLPFEPKKFGYDVGFHNADIPVEEREDIEGAFRDGRLKVLIATQTLAYGINLPADRVIIFARKIRRNRFIPDAIDILQMEGRAGRFGIKDMGFVEVYVWSRGKRADDIENEILQTFSGIKPFVSSLGGNLNIWEYWGISSFISLMMLGAVNFSPNDWRKFLSYIPSMKSIKPEFVDVVYSYLEENGFIENGKLTRIGKVMLENSISPIAYMEMKRRVGLNVETLISIRPLLYMKRIKGSLKAFIKDKFFEERRRFINYVVRDMDFPDDGSDEVWMFVSGGLFPYRNISNPPGELGFSQSDLYHLARTLHTLKEEGFIFITDEDILRVLHSYKYGLPINFSPLGGISNIGFLRANALYRALDYMNFRKVDFGEIKIPENLTMFLEEALYIRYKDLNTVKKEMQTIMRSIREDPILGDKNLLKIMLIIKKKQKALKYLGLPKENMLKVLKLV